jgi:hypothetical protein
VCRPLAQTERCGFRCDFYTAKLGFTLDVDYAPVSEFRVIQLTPQGSSASMEFGVGLIALRQARSVVCISSFSTSRPAGAYSQIDGRDYDRDGEGQNQDRSESTPENHNLIVG